MDELFWYCCMVRCSAVFNVPIKGLTIPFSNQFNCKETVPITASRSYIHVVDVDRVLQLPLASETSIQIESLASLSHNSSYFNSTDPAC